MAGAWGVQERSLLEWISQAKWKEVTLSKAEIEGIKTGNDQELAGAWWLRAQTESDCWVQSQGPAV